MKRKEKNVFLEMFFEKENLCSIELMIDKQNEMIDENHRRNKFH